MSLAANNEAAPQARAVAESKLRELMAWLKSNLGRTQKSDDAHGGAFPVRDLVHRTVPGEPGRDRIKPARRYARWLTNLSESCHQGLSR